MPHLLHLPCPLVNQEFFEFRQNQGNMGRQFDLDEKNPDHIIVSTDIKGKGGLMAKEKAIIYGKAG